MATTEKRTTQHTPGPWTYTEKDNRGWHSIRTVGEIICQLPWEAEANARLIAAEPEMLAALMETARAWHYGQAAIPGSPCYKIGFSRCDAALCAANRALLAKIEGQA